MDNKDKIIQNLINQSTLDNQALTLKIEQNLALKEENEKLNKIKEIALQMHYDWNEFDPINESYIDKIENNNKQLKEKLKVAETMVGLLIKDAMCDDEYTCEADRKEFYNNYKQHAIRIIGEIE